MVLTNYYGTTPAGTITKEQTLLSIRRLPVEGAVNIVKGNVCTIKESTGNVIIAATTPVAGSPWFVALENANNTSGTDGAISVPLAVKGHFVTVVADGVIYPGNPVKTSGSTAGQVVAFDQGTDAEGLKVGIYWGKEGGKVTKDSVTPYDEERTDAADFVPVVCADGDIIEIELR